MPRSLDQNDGITFLALLLTSDSLFARGDLVAAKNYAGSASRMIPDMRLHTIKPTLSDVDLGLRKRIFWAPFVVDKVQVLYHGQLVRL